ncbi:TPA: PerC family transcriptional regulator [Klebsiella pneumoniae]|nr:PerC family transcriptional regulator [Klebsiella pneumoniae]
MELKDSIAELLESRGQWRRAARRWLAVMDLTDDEAEREAIARRREHCVDMSANIPLDRRRSETRRLYKIQSRYDAGY